MRVLTMISGLAMGGAERNVLSILPHLKNIPGVTPFLCTLETRRDSALVDKLAATGVVRYDLGARRLLDPAAWRRFLALLDELKIDVVSTQDQYTNFFGTLARWSGKVPVVMTRHVMREPDDTYREALKAKLVLRAARHGATRLIAVSEAVRQHFSRQANIPLSRIETIYNGIDIEHFATRERRMQKRAEMGWGPEDRVLIIVAVLRRGKGHEVLFRGIPRLEAAFANLRIVVVGDGELNDALRQQAAQHGAVVQFLGERSDVAELLGASDALVLPSWSEALPTVLIEAGAARLPCVATDVGGTREIVEDGRTGFVVPAGDTDQLTDRVIETLSDLPSAERMGARAFERVSKTFSLERQAESMIAVFEKARAAA